MKIQPKNVRRFQQGGPMPAEDPAMAEEAVMAEQGDAPDQGGDPIMQLAQMSMQALQSQDCNMAMQVCEMFVQLVQQSQGGAPGPEVAPEGEPVYRRGGKLAYRIKK